MSTDQIAKNVNFKRILLKLSGELLLADQIFGINETACQKLAKIIKDIILEGYELGIVIGGGNIFRGLNLAKSGFSRTPADHMGMLATLMNGIALEQALKKIDCPSYLMSALPCEKIAETYNWTAAKKYLATKAAVIFTCGTGNPYFTTDTAAALRACEMQADILIKATKVDGIYSADPLQYKNAVKYQTLSYERYLTENLKVLDTSAVALCRDSSIPILVFSMENLGKISFKEILRLKTYGTLIKHH